MAVNIRRDFVVRENVWDEFAARKRSLDFRHIHMVASVSQILSESLASALLCCGATLAVHLGHIQSR